MIPCATCNKRFQELVEYSSARPAISYQKQGVSFYEFVIDQPGFGPEVKSFFPDQGKFDTQCEMCLRVWSWHYNHRYEDQARLKISRHPGPKKPKPKSANPFSDADRKREAKRTGRPVGGHNPVPPLKTEKPKPKPRVKTAPKVDKETRDLEDLAREIQNFVPEVFGIEEQPDDWANTAELTWSSEGGLAKAFELENVHESEPLYLIFSQSPKSRKWNHSWPETVKKHELKIVNGTSLHVYKLEKNELAVNLLEEALWEFGATIVAPRRFRIFSKTSPNSVTVSKPF